ncbi:MAG: hypothetical protein AAFW75_24665 [Cyanobacteria bacterium J06636_16]
MKIVPSSTQEQVVPPQYMYQQAVDTSINNALTGDTLFLIQMMCMTPAAIFFMVCLIIHLYRKYAFNQEISRRQQIANLERSLHYEADRKF